MVQHYSPKTFLRQTSNTLLQACFNKHEALAGVAWNDLAEHQIDAIYDAWQELPAEQRVSIERRFEDADDLANELGIKYTKCAATLNGAPWRDLSSLSARTVASSGGPVLATVQMPVWPQRWHR